MIRRRSLLEETGGEFIEGFIILDQTKSDPTQKVVDMTGNTYSSGYVRPAVIDAIRAASHCYVGTYDSTNQKMSLKQLNDGNHTLYADGTSASSDITSKDVFMRLPFFFTRATQPETDKWKIEFAYDLNQTVSRTATPSGSGWMRWGGTDLIGKYEGYVASSNLYSRSGKTPVRKNVSLQVAQDYGNARGNMFSITKWRHHNIIGILFYAYYGHTNCQELCGSGSNSSSRTTGQKDTFGMTDTDSTNGNTNNIVFWGLENWWGGCVEYVDNILYSNGNVAVTEDDGTTRRISTIPTAVSIYPRKFIIGDYLDLIPIKGDTSTGSSSTGYCDFFTTTTKYANRACRTSGIGSDVEGGVATLYFNGSSTSSTAGNSCRITYTGPMEIVPQQVNDFVDLGLPSGRKWAKGNIVSDGNGGYKIGEKTDWGTNISWGNIDGHNEGEGYDFSSTNYNSTPGASVAANIPSNDAQHDICLAKLGTPWNLPTKEDYQELYDNTDSEWVADYNGTGVAGRKFMKKTDHSVYVFFPASGLSNGTSLNYRGSNGRYWSSSWYSSSYAYSLYFGSSTVNPQSYDTRRYGFSVRAIR